MECSRLGSKDGINYSVLTKLILDIYSNLNFDEESIKFFLENLLADRKELSRTNFVK